MKFSPKEITLTGLFTAITVILAQLRFDLPISPVPITFSLVAVFLSAILLNPKCSFFSQLVYILLGICGLPVFSGFSGGIGILAGAKGGYIISFPIMTLVVGLILRRKQTASRIDLAVALIIGLAICYTLGTVWLGLVTGVSAATAITSGIIPFLPLDTVKVILTALAGYELRRSLDRAGLLVR